jgi:hypothetical protein
MAKSIKFDLEPLTQERIDAYLIWQGISSPVGYVTDLDTGETWPQLPYDYTAKVIQENYYEYSPPEFTDKIKAAGEKVAELEKATKTEDESVVRWSWLGEYMEVSRTNYGTDKIEIVGLLKVPGDQPPDSDKAAVVYLTTRFLALMDKIREEKMPLTRLPEIVIGQVGSGYQAQVTLTLAAELPVS